jgi:hypothetical protein
MRWSLVRSSTSRAATIASAWGSRGRPSMSLLSSICSRRQAREAGSDPEKVGILTPPWEPRRAGCRRTGGRVQCKAFSLSAPRIPIRLQLLDPLPEKGHLQRRYTRLRGGYGLFRSDRFGTFRGREHSEDFSRINRIGAVVVSLCRQSPRLNGAVDCRFRDASVAGGFSQAQHGVPLWRHPVTIAVNRNPFLRNPQFTTASKAARLFGQCGGCALGSVAREGSGCVMRPALRYWPVGRSAGLDCMAAFDPLQTLTNSAAGKRERCLLGRVTATPSSAFSPSQNPGSRPLIGM